MREGIIAIEGADGGIQLPAGYGTCSPASLSLASASAIPGSASFQRVRNFS